MPTAKKSKMKVVSKELVEDMATKVVDNRYYFTETMDDFELPNLIEVQLDSYKWFLDKGIRELLDEVSPISDFSGKKLDLVLKKHTIDKPKYDAQIAKRRNMSYEANLKVGVQLINKETGEIKEQEVFLGAIPLMTEKGTFVVNGVERVVVNQLVRSPGVFYSQNPLFAAYYNAKIIPKRGAWLELETDKKGVIYVKIDRKRKMPVTQLFRVFGYAKDKDILALFEDLSVNVKNDFILNTLEKDNAKTPETAYQSIYKKIRPGDFATPENAKQLIDAMFFDFKRYDMGPIARYKLNKRFGTKIKDTVENRVFQVEDLVNIVRHLISLNKGEGQGDDIDHLSNRRIRSVGELVQNKFRVGLLRSDRIAKDRMTIMESETVTPTQLINCRPITAAMREFFASSQLSQFMDQTNPLAELAHKRRLSAMGPGGLSRERASFDVRDVHTSHYGRICPIATPEGPNIGLVVHLATYARVNDYGFIETPFREVASTCPADVKALEGRILDEEIAVTKANVLEPGTEMDKKLAETVVKYKRAKKEKDVVVRSYVTDEIKYFDSDEERALTIAEANSKMDEKGQFLMTRVSSRKRSEPILAHVRDLTHIDISPKQIISETTALIPFLEHDDNTRASMGSNMQRQSVSLISPESPYVGTGMEGLIARSSGQTIVAEEDGEVLEVEANKVTVLYDNGKKKEHEIENFVRSNQTTCMHARPIVYKGNKVNKGDTLVDGASVQNGELALGQNLLVAYMPWNGYNYEDAIIISDKVVRDGKYDSIHIEVYTMDVRDTQLGPEIITRDIPNVGEAKLKDLDEDGVIRIGATVNEGDILIGKITPKGETELSAEERLLQAIFGDKAKDVKDTSLKLGGGAGGKVVDVQTFTRDQGDELPMGVIRQLRVFVAQTRRVQIGDKMAGRHGNKGVISKIVPEEDMPFLPDGTPVDIILNPLGVSSRMNIGQVLETHLGWAAKKLGIKVATPALNGIKTEMITEIMVKAELPEHGKIQLFDGMTGEPFHYETTVGINYILKLSHLIEDKLHARSVGPYSLVTQQPLGGKAQHGGQRFGEMEVWALEAYGASYILQEMLTIKSDDVMGRAKAYESIVKGEPIKAPNIPESFNVLVKELQSLCLHVDLMEYGRDGAETIELETDEKVAENKEIDDKIAELDIAVEEEETTEEILDELKGDDIGGADAVTEMEEALEEKEESES